MVLFVEDTGIKITDSNRWDFNINANQIFHNINTWFNINLLTLTPNKTLYIQFRTKNYYNVNTQIKYDQKGITNATDIKFLGLLTDDTLSKKQHIEHLVNKMCIAKYQTCSTNRYSKSTLFCSYTLYHELQYNFLG